MKDHKTGPYARPNASDLGTGRLKGQGEIVLHEIINLIFPDGKEVKNSDELNLRLQTIPGMLSKYGYGPKI